MNVHDAVSAVPTGLLIGGAEIASTDGLTFGVRNPATGVEIARVADAHPDDGLLSLDAAVEAADSWARATPRMRSDLLHAAYDSLLRQTETVATIITLEMGKPLGEARAEVAYAAEFLRWFSEQAVRIDGRVTAAPHGGGQIQVTREPVGPCFLITPWNLPLAMATRKIGPALAAGCTVVIKPAESTPLATLLLGRVFSDVGLPPGVLNVIPTTRSVKVSAPIISDARLRKLSFTGSTNVGRQLLSQASQNVLRTSMELGGNAPFVVFDDADLARTVTAAMTAKFRNMGQACTAANRFLVHERVAEEFVRELTARVRELVMGDGLTPAVTLGPLIDERAVDRIDSLVADAVTRGATVLTGGERPTADGSFYPATVLTGVDPASRIATEEIFGPVVAVSTFRTDEEAIQLANSTEYGLAAYAFTRDLARAQRLRAGLRTGMLGVNTGFVSDVAAPFGGVKQSGIGHEGGVEGIEDYLSMKYTRFTD